MGSDAQARQRRTERGFTLIEMIVVMAILAILAAIVIGTFAKSRSQGYKKQTVAAASSYAGAISGFKLDHSGRVPAFGNRTDWPSAPAGPVNLVGRPYTKAPPESIGSGLDTISIGAPAAGGVQRGWLQYVPTPTGRAFELRVFTRESPSDAWVQLCSLGDAIPTGSQPCQG